MRTLSEHRGSHGAAAIGRQLMVMGGGGMRANLSSMEALDTHAGAGAGGAGGEAAASGWGPAPSMLTPRHAFAIAHYKRATDGKTVLFASGGWAYGSVCVGAVECFTEGDSEWRGCAALTTPRRLHGAACDPAAADGALLVFGGSVGNGAVDAKIKVILHTT